MVLLDYVGQPRRCGCPREASSDAALWGACARPPRASGVARSFPNTTGVGLFDDHTPFLDAGIPAVDLIDFDYPWQGHARRHASTRCRPRSLDVVGETVTDLVLRERLR